MSEERLARIENQLDLLIQGMTTMNNRVGGIESRVGGIESHISGIETRMDSMDNRINSLEGTLLTTMREGFASLHSYQLDLDRDLALNEQKTEDNARKTRRINHRLLDLEQRNED
jgi:predicted  nucleic acid-binding Zn-ribbon protein